MEILEHPREITEEIDVHAFGNLLFCETHKTFLYPYKGEAPCCLKAERDRLATLIRPPQTYICSVCQREVSLKEGSANIDTKVCWECHEKVGC